VIAFRHHIPFLSNAFHAAIFQRDQFRRKDKYPTFRPSARGAVADRGEHAKSGVCKAEDEIAALRKASLAKAGLAGETCR
jgi:hypothetical protein